MTNAIYFIFFIVIPVISLIYRFRKKISTGFALSGIITSFLLGLLVGGTFLQDPWEELVVYLNRNDLHNARIELKRILQDNPEYLHNITDKQLKDPEVFKEIKRDVEREYLDIAQKYINDNNNFTIQGNINCNELPEYETELGKIKNSMRLLNMAEIIGGDQSASKEKLSAVINLREKIISRSKKKCSETGSK